MHHEKETEWSLSIRKLENRRHESMKYDKIKISLRTLLEKQKEYENSVFNEEEARALITMNDRHYNTTKLTPVPSIPTIVNSVSDASLLPAIPPALDNSSRLSPNQSNMSN